MTESEDDQSIQNEILEGNIKTDFAHKFKLV